MIGIFNFGIASNKTKLRFHEYLFTVTLYTECFARLPLSIDTNLKGVLINQNNKPRFSSAKNYDLAICG